MKNEEIIREDISYYQIKIVKISLRGIMKVSQTESVGPYLKQF